jgi:uncharacterized protein (TIGR00299 family) protein
VDPDRLGWLDATGGLSGDMLLGALIGAGAPLDAMNAALAALAVPLGPSGVSPAPLGLSWPPAPPAPPGGGPEPAAGDGRVRVQLAVSAVDRAGLRATRAHVRADEANPPRRTWADIERLLTAAPLDDDVRRRARATFGALAAAEAAVHGIPAAEVHFHEVGALDALADVVGVCAGLSALGLRRLVVSPIALGGGEVRAAHGLLPVPGPAVLELLRAGGLTGYGGGAAMELCTPTGAALVVANADEQGELPPMTITGVGVGAGGRDRPDRPNVVRLVLGTAAPEPARAAIPPPAAGRTADLAPADPAPAGAAPVHAAPAGAVLPGATPPGATPPGVDEIVLACNIDDLDPRVWPDVLAVLLAAGARDAWLTPIIMKKGRPAHTLSALVGPAEAAAVRDAIFMHTSTLGLRETAVVKRALERRFRAVYVDGQRIAVKLGSLPDGRMTTAQPEWEDVRRAAAALGRPARAVIAEALARLAR